MDQYTITGMSCAACSARVEKAVSQVEGVESCAVSLLTNSMGVTGTASPEAIIAAVEKAGYGAKRKSAQKAGAQPAAAAAEDALRDTETPKLKKRLIVSLVFLLVLMYFSMGHSMFGWPLPAFFDANHVAMGLVQLLLAGIVMVINQRFFTSGFASLAHRAPNMDTLVAMGSAASFAYSVYALFSMTRAQADGGSAAAMPWMHEFYFESAAMILTLITVGKMLEARSKGKTTDALKSLMKLAPKTASVVRGGAEQTVAIEEVRIDDVFLVRPGENVPVDGVILEGQSALSEAALTGESIPVDKAAGDTVFAATVNQSGLLKCRATRVGEDTTLSQIIRMVSDAAATKAPIAKIADKVSGIFVPAVLGIAAVTLLVWLLVGQSFGYALARAISVLVISCPCALGLATPVAIMVGSGVGAKNGILFKTAVSLEAAGRTQIVVLDKTGTITGGVPKITDLAPADGVSEDELLRLAAALESGSEHPLAKAVLDGAEQRGIAAGRVSEFSALPGNGLAGRVEGARMEGGSLRYISSRTQLSAQVAARADELSRQGKTPLLFLRGGDYLGMIAVADVIKEDSPQAVRELRNMGIRVVMLTGDNALTAGAIGREAGVDRVVAGVLPDGKEAEIRRLSQYGKVAMVGDGINDAPALTRADVGIAIGAGTDVAIDAADIVLMKSRLSDVPAAIRLSRQTLRNIRQNLFWAFCYNVIGIPLAAGVWIKLFGLTLNPMFGAAAMSLSSFCVVTNALWLNWFDLRSALRDKPGKGCPVELPPEEEQAAASCGPCGPRENGNDGCASSCGSQQEEEDAIMIKTTVGVEGMMCPMCEAHVNDAIRNGFAVESVQSSHKDKRTVIVSKEALPEEAVREAINKTGYTVTSYASETYEKKAFHLFGKK